MFERKKGRTKVFEHADDCKIAKADAGVQIQWSETRRGHWEAVCTCGREYYDEPRVDHRVRNDPLDPKTSRHAGECEFASEKEPAVLKLLLKVTDKESYWWVQCGSCECGWQVPYFARETVG